MSDTTKAKIFRPRGMEADGMKYYQERDKTGDYVSVDPGTAEYYCRIGQAGMVEGRAPALHGEVSTVCTVSLSREWLNRKCRRVRKADVPQAWRERLEP